ncbi:hypothetical protein M3T53_01125 [Actinomyces sp. B33]|uniref:hypothetical protein n=1 Tax=Actinomyces sp. B33 TaxID=2942131 RepID=UPI00234195AB|nr:hypothetical protein [Actinomyces sp. B33]MDC4232317.1 hypothetical protein [Actinomyces sp. B33]
MSEEEFDDRPTAPDETGDFIVDPEFSFDPVTPEPDAGAAGEPPAIGGGAPTGAEDSPSAVEDGSGAPEPPTPAEAGPSAVQGRTDSDNLDEASDQAGAENHDGADVRMPDDAAESSAPPADEGHPDTGAPAAAEPIASASASMWAAARDRSEILTGEEIEMPGEIVDEEDIVGEASPLETSQIEPVVVGAHTTTIPVVAPPNEAGADAVADPGPAASSADEAPADFLANRLSSGEAPGPVGAADAAPSPEDADEEPVPSPEAGPGAPDPAAAVPVAVVSTAVDPIEDTTTRRRSLMTATPSSGEPQLEAAWKPRSDASERRIVQETPGSLDDSIFEGATVVAEVPSRGGAHWASLASFLLLVPVAWYLAADAGARMTLAEGNTLATGALSPVGLGELVAAAVLGLVLVLLSLRSSLGPWVTGVLVTLAGLPWLVAPAHWGRLIIDYLRSVSNAHPVGANLVHHAQASGYSGRLLLLGLALIALGAVSHSARRRGRAEEALRAEVEKVNPAGAYFSARQRRKAAKAAAPR